MRTIENPTIPELFERSSGIIHERAQALMDSDWPGIMRTVLLELMPAEELGKTMSERWGRPSKELYAMAGLIFLAEAFGWTHQEAVEKFIFDMRVQYALNIGHFNQYLCERTYENRLRDFRESALAQDVFDSVARRLVQAFDINIKKQRLDSTHVFSNMARFGRTKLMAETIRRFVRKLAKVFPDQYEALPSAVRERYTQSDAQLFGMGGSRKKGDELGRLRLQIAEDMYQLIALFENNQAIVALAGYAALVRIFHEQCVVDADTVALAAKPDSWCMQNPSDPDATYDGHKGPGYQAQIAETFGAENEVNFITAVIAETAADQDVDALVPIVEQLTSRGMTPDMLLADTLYGSDENVLAAQQRDVELVAPTPGRKPRAGDAQQAPTSVTEFSLDETTQEALCCPQGQRPQTTKYDPDSGEHTAVFDADKCRQCAKRHQCPTSIKKSKAALRYTDKDIRLEKRRAHEQSTAFRDIYRCRAGIEGTMSALKRRLGLGRLRVRGKTAVDTAIYLKATGYNMLQAVKMLKRRKNGGLASVQCRIIAIYLDGVDAMRRLWRLWHRKWREKQVAEACWKNYAIAA